MQKNSIAGLQINIFSKTEGSTQGSVILHYSSIKIYNGIILKMDYNMDAYGLWDLSMESVLKISQALLRYKLFCSMSK